jgi:hypothetical protein
LSVGFIVAGNKGIKEEDNKIKTFTGVTTGKLIRFDKSYINNNAIIPVFEYSANGFKYNYFHNNYTLKQSHKIGDMIKIYFNPNDPNQTYAPSLSNDIYNNFIVYKNIGIILCLINIIQFAIYMIIK